MPRTQRTPWIGRYGKLFKEIGRIRSECPIISARLQLSQRLVPTDLNRELTGLPKTTLFIFRYKSGRNIRVLFLQS